MENRKLVSALLLALLVFYSVAAVARVIHFQEDVAPGWDPIACLDCDAAADMIGPIIFGYILGAFVGVMGIGRRRLAALDVRASILRLP